MEIKQFKAARALAEPWVQVAMDLEETRSRSMP
jgi:hypothetical protein